MVTAGGTMLNALSKRADVASKCYMLVYFQVDSRGKKTSLDAIDVPIEYLRLASSASLHLEAFWFLQSVFVSVQRR